MDLKHFIKLIMNNKPKYLPENFLYTGDPSKDFEWLQNNHPDIFIEVIKNNEYELKKEDVENKNIIDIGANIGTFTLYSAYLGAKQIISVEPSTDTFQKLTENIGHYAFNNIKLLKNVVLNISGIKIKLPIQINSGHNSIFKKTENFEMVETITLKEILARITNPDDIILKIDCEGSEYDILLNMSASDFERVKTIHIEIHSDIHPIYREFDIIENKIISFGFKKIRDKRMFGYIANEQGEIVDSVPLPTKLCCFERL